MLTTVERFRERVEDDCPRLIEELQTLTGRYGAEEAQAWENSLGRLSRIFQALSFQPLHLYFGSRGHLALEYQLPASAAWCDVVLLGAHNATRSAVILELKDWTTRGDRPGRYEGLIERQGRQELHPSEQVRGYTQYCRRFHSAVADHRATRSRGSGRERTPRSTSSASGRVSLAPASRRRSASKGCSSAAPAPRSSSTGSIRSCAFRGSARRHGAGTWLTNPSARTGSRARPCPTRPGWMSSCSIGPIGWKPRCASASSKATACSSCRPSRGGGGRTMLPIPTRSRPISWTSRSPTRSTARPGSGVASGTSSDPMVTTPGT
jgi:hypothetical protein